MLPDICVPLLTLNARDDPVVRRIPESVDNPYVIMATTNRGGHLGWFVNGSDKWIRKPVLEWLRMCGEEIAHSNRERAIALGDDGFLREEGDGQIGCREIGPEDLEYIVKSGPMDIWRRLRGLLRSV